MSTPGSLHLAFAGLGATAATVPVVLRPLQAHGPGVLAGLLVSVRRAPELGGDTALPQRDAGPRCPVPSFAGKAQPNG